jgi:hypothetical protein
MDKIVAGDQIGVKRRVVSLSIYKCSLSTGRGGVAWFTETRLG